MSQKENHVPNNSASHITLIQNQSVLLASSYCQASDDTTTIRSLWSDTSIQIPDRSCLCRLLQLLDHREINKESRINDVIITLDFCSSKAISWKKGHLQYFAILHNSRLNPFRPEITNIYVNLAWVENIVDYAQWVIG